MEKDQVKKRLFISAAEPSADAHCAGLIKQLRKENCDIEFFGVGGEKMQSAGCELIERTGHKAAMTYNAFRQVGQYFKLINKIKRFLKENKIDLVVVCDSPAFNFHVAKAAKKTGIKTLFYVAPQLWAWAPWRIRKLRKNCDKLCCILPFEEKWFSERGIDVTFVGNPLLDEIQVRPAQNKKSYSDFEPSKAKVAIMPGSRPAEIETLWVPMQQTALRLKEKFGAINFTTVAVDEEKKKTLIDKQIPGFECTYNTGTVFESAKTADFSIVASGSATLQVAAAGCPMVIMYQSSRILWHLVGRWIVTTKYLSLVNILAQEELVPEFMPYFSSIKPIIESIENLLIEKQKLIEISSRLIELTEPLAEASTAEKTAQIAIDTML